MSLASGRPIRPKGRQTVPGADFIRLELPGGGGFGDPLERDMDKVAEDVREGYVGAEVAREVYRVALDARGRVDAEATRVLRSTSGTARAAASVDVAWDGQ